MQQQEDIIKILYEIRREPDKLLCLVEHYHNHTKIKNSPYENEVKDSTQMEDKIITFLEKIAKESFNRDNYYVFLNKKKTAYIFGYTNDYPLQHGKGEENRISVNTAKFLFKKFGDKI